jgi:hypothetical protein
MVTIIATIVIVAGVACYMLNPYLFQDIISTVARWFRFGQ